MTPVRRASTIEDVVQLTSTLRRFRTPLLLGASAAVVAAAMAAGGSQAGVRAIATPAPTPEPAQVPVFEPTALAIPSIGLEPAPIVKVGTLADGTMDSPRTAIDVGWHAYTKPGEGNALFAAHHDYKGALGSFYRLADVKAGDEILVYGPDGVVSRYRATWVRQVGGDTPEAPDILATREGEPEVTLITCGGYFDSSTGHHVDRIVVRGVPA